MHALKGDRCRLTARYSGLAATYCVARPHLHPGQGREGGCETQRQHLPIRALPFMAPAHQTLCDSVPVWQRSISSLEPFFQEAGAPQRALWIWGLRVPLAQLFPSCSVGLMVGSGPPIHPSSICLILFLHFCMSQELRAWHLGQREKRCFWPGRKGAPFVFLTFRLGMCSLTSSQTQS